MTFKEWLHQVYQAKYLLLILVLIITTGVVMLNATKATEEEMNILYAYVGLTR